MVNLASWGRLNTRPHTVYTLYDQQQSATLLQQQSQPGLAYGMGRSYGDVCLNPYYAVWHTVGLDRLIYFDEKNGRLKCEAGVLLRDIQRLMIPRGWMLAVTPGTQYVTVGGAIANDVHGKNHHIAGTFGEHITELTLLRTDGTQIICCPTQKADWLYATIGGLGLTGLILTAEIQLKRVAGPWLAVETLPYAQLSDFFTLADESEEQWEYTVSWFDCCSRRGRGLFMRANPLALQTPAPHKIRLSIPFTPPFSLINAYSLPLFNQLYYSLQKKQFGRSIVHYESFFYPLDHVLNWNRLYGPHGFYQYQCVLPQHNRLSATQALLNELSLAHEGSFLAVLKTFGQRPAIGLLSFVQEAGVTLALDFPNKKERSLKLFTRLDAIVKEAQGRLYPAKDARMPPELFAQGYPKLAHFLSYRDAGISSAFSRRLLGS